MLRHVVLIAGLWGAAAGAVIAHDPPAKPSVAAQALTSVERQAAATVEAFHAALERGDTAGALALMDDDVLIFEQGGAERSKAEYAAEHLIADAEFASATRAERTAPRVRLAGQLAVVTSEARTTGRFREREVNSAGVETMVLRRTRSGWRISHIHWSSRSLAAR
jgi:ketosteroid isomerase-like protein